MGSFMISTYQLSLINACIGGINSSYEDKHVVDEGFINRYNKDGLRMTVKMTEGNRILTVYPDLGEGRYSYKTILEINLGPVVGETQPNGPTDTTGDVVEFKMAEAA